ncbi:hypothetical protein AAP_01483 [Ascosphaera apis ARSEF 7405]|uniref:C2H2-type domain-containing protein n=1 Tax=Ascosphaera apis ARSEF 7405 TaxID=392613 RepID=A0A168BVS6_9EURO|nr:hypothetical protein AAP_01483 [Ascosphaera apis ARSEF 7405]
MGRAEVGSTKYISNKLKSKGLQRLRWYCQVCERQMRDENGFKCHTQSESHVRQMLLVGEDPKKYINQYSQEFLSDFIKLLRTAHGEKPVHINHFYQEYIANKEHIHMNATKWTSLTEFAKYLGKESICRVEEGEKGLFIAWIDNSPEALRRQDAIRKKERQDRGDEEREKKMIEEQIRRAQLDSAAKKKQEEDAEEAEDESRRMLQRAEGEKVKLSFAPKTTTTTTTATTTTSAAASPSTATTESPNTPETAPSAEAGAAAAAKKKNALGDTKKATSSSSTPNTASRPLSATERIIKEDMERKRRREGGAGVGFYSTKKSRVA